MEDAVRARQCIRELALRQQARAHLLDEGRMGNQRGAPETGGNRGQTRRFRRLLF